jgi:hypothetical protein
MLLNFRTEVGVGSDEPAAATRTFIDLLRRGGGKLPPVSSPVDGSIISVDAETIVYLHSPQRGESSHKVTIDSPAAEEPRLTSHGHPACHQGATLMSRALSGVVAEHIRAINAFDTEAVIKTFSEDAYVNDTQREIVGIKAIRAWIEKEIVGEHVTVRVHDVRDHYGDPIVQGLYDGDYDKTNLPAELILTNYFKVRNGKIVSLIIVFNKPSPY